MSGKLTDMTTKTPVSGAEVSLYYSEVSSGVLNPEFKLLETTNTDQSGNYNFSFESKVFYKFRLIFKKNGYHSRSIDFDPENIAANYEKNETIAKESYLKMIISSKPETDHTLSVHVKDINSLCDFCCSGPFYFSGQGINETLTCYTVGGEKVTVEAFEKDEYGNNSGHKIEEFDCPIGDTIVFNYRF